MSREECTGKLCFTLNFRFFIFFSRFGFRLEKPFSAFVGCARPASNTTKRVMVKVNEVNDGFNLLDLVLPLLSNVLVFLFSVYSIRSSVIRFVTRRFVWRVFFFFFVLAETTRAMVYAVWFWFCSNALFFKDRFILFKLVEKLSTINFMHRKNVASV